MWNAKPNPLLPPSYKSTSLKNFKDTEMFFNEKYQFHKEHTRRTREMSGYRIWTESARLIPVWRSKPTPTPVDPAVGNRGVGKIRQQRRDGHHPHLKPALRNVYCLTPHSLVTKKRSGDNFFTPANQHRWHPQTHHCFHRPCFVSHRKQYFLPVYYKLHRESFSFLCISSGYGHSLPSPLPSCQCTHLSRH